MSEKLKYTGGIDGGEEARDNKNKSRQRQGYQDGLTCEGSIVVEAARNNSVKDRKGKKVTSVPACKKKKQRSSQNIQKES